MKINFRNTYKPNFQSTNRRYTDYKGDEFGCYTTFFRSDLNWEKLSDFEFSNFAKKDKVNIIMFASSDGSEAYSTIISLLENKIGKKQKSATKFLPIQAYDIDDEIINVANSGYIKATNYDLSEIISRSEEYNDYFEKSNKKLEIKNANDDTGIVLKAKESLTKNVKFNKGNMFQKIREIKDDSNTILMCRNILGYFLNDKIEEFIKLASNILKKDSLFIIGDYDSEFVNIRSILEKFNFQKVLKNVYKKK